MGIEIALLIFLVALAAVFLSGSKSGFTGAPYYIDGYPQRIDPVYGNVAPPFAEGSIITGDYRRGF